MDSGFSRIDEKTRSIQVLTAASGTGAPDVRCRFGPMALRERGLESQLRQNELRVVWRDVAVTDTLHLPAPESVARVAERLADNVTSAIREGSFVVVLGGDHSCAIGTWSGAAKALRRRGPIGLIWVDAHMDSHTPETTPSGNYHGMPVACLLGHGDKQLVKIAGRSPAVDPRHLCLIGIRSYERGEADLLERLGVAIFDAAAVKQRGLDSVMADAVSIATKGTAGFGVSVDVDAVDPGEAPGVGTPAAGGLKGDEIRASLRHASRHQSYIGFELAELNPALDQSGATVQIASEIVAAAVPGKR
jgi:arginase